MLNWSQWNFAHIVTATSLVHVMAWRRTGDKPLPEPMMSLLWHVQYFIVIGGAHFKPQHFKFWSNFKFDRNIVKMTNIFHTISTWKFSKEFFFLFLFNYHWRANWKQGIIGSGNMVWHQKRHQAINWTNHDKVYWCIHVSLGLNELINGALLMSLCSIHWMGHVT